ncbi:MAG: alpha/beta fold hydrolase [Chloroflexi bacterium]|nr:alpha/beta fold hydrolase [Chloroflexota bacterium]
MLLIMGLGTQMVFWDDQFCSQLAAHGYWVIRFDNRDVGLSSRLDELGVPKVVELYLHRELLKDFKPPYTIEDMAGDALGLMRALEIEAAHVVGVSMGGMIGQVMAINHPDCLLTLSSIMSSTGDPSLPAPSAEGAQLLITPSPEEREAFIEYSVEVWQILSGTTYTFSLETLQEMAGISFDRGRSAAGFARQLSAILANGSRRERLKSVKLPVLVIHGDADPLMPLEGGIDTANSIPGAKKLIIEGMGHALPPGVWPQVIEAITQHAV